MPASYNRVTLVGNLTRDVDLKRTSGGTAVCDLSLAVNDKVKRDGNWVDDVTFVDVTVWGRTAEVADEYLSKGASVLIEGRLKLDQWESDGQKRSKLRVVGERMQMLGGGQDRPQPAPQRPASVRTPDGRDDADYDNPPF